MKINRIFLSIAVLLIASTLYGQGNPSKQTTPPIRLDKVPANKLAVPSDLPILGASYYDFLVAPTGQINVKLYDSKAEPIAALEIQENLLEHSVLFKYSDKYGENWIRTVTTQLQDETLFQVTSSTGAEMRVKAKMDSSKNSRKLRTSSISLANELGWAEYPLDGFEPTSLRLNAQHALQVEEAKFFNNAGLLKLREFIQNFGRLRDVTVQTWTGKPETNETSDCNKKKIALNEGEMELVLGCGGVAFCTRISTIVPIFACNGGNSCTGFYIVPDYILSLFFTANCSYLNGCA